MLQDRQNPALQLTAIALSQAFDFLGNIKPIQPIADALTSGPLAKQLRLASRPEHEISFVEIAHSDLRNRYRGAQSELSGKAKKKKSSTAI
jgi:hypothetical protein